MVGQTIAASVIGYALLRTDIEVADAPLDMTIRLSEGAGAYTERVSVSGSLRRESDSVAGGTSLYGRELETLRGAVLDDPLRAVQSLPSATATDDFYSEFAVRGNPFRYVGLVVDGVPTRYLMHAVNGITDGGSIAMINSETLGSVSLLPGSYPQRTGRQMGAEVGMSTREGSRDEFRGRAGLSGTSVTFLGEGPIASGKGSWLASIRRSYLDYLIKRIDPEAGFAFGFVDAQAKAVYDVSPRHQVSISALLGRAVFEEGDPDIGVNEIRTAISRAWLSSLSWRYLPSPRLAVTQRLYSTGLHFDNDNRNGATLDTSRSTQVWMARRCLIRADDGRGRRVRRRCRTPRRPQRHRPAALSDDAPDHAQRPMTNTRRPASAYGQVRFASRVSIDGDARQPRRPLVADRSDDGLAVGERRVPSVRAHAPSRRQRHLSSVSGSRRGARHSRRRRTICSPERALHVDAGIEQALPRQTRVLFNVYMREERDVLWAPGAEPQLVSNAVSPGAFNAPWVNALSGDARGAEIVVRRDAADGFSGWAGYAFSRLRYTDTRTGESFWGDADQRHTLSLYGNYRLSSRTSLSARYRYGSNYPMLGYIGEAPPRCVGPAACRSTIARCSTGWCRNATRCGCRPTRAWTSAPIARSPGRAGASSCSSTWRTS